MCVYFIQSVDGGLIKIGYSNDPRKRLKTLQLTSPVKLQILGIISNATVEIERYYHGQFINLRTYGEWFHPSDTLIEFIKNNSAKVLDESKVKVLDLPELVDDLESINPFRQIYKMSGKTQQEVSLDLNMSPGTVERIVRERGIDDSIKLSTRQRFARYFGYRVVITLEPIEESGNGT